MIIKLPYTFHFRKKSFEYFPPKLNRFISLYRGNKNGGCFLKHPPFVDFQSQHPPFVLPWHLNPIVIQVFVASKIHREILLTKKTPAERWVNFTPQRVFSFLSLFKDLFQWMFCQNQCEMCFLDFLSTMMETQCVSSIFFGGGNFSDPKKRASKAAYYEPIFWGGMELSRHIPSSKSRGSPAARATISSFLNSTSLRCGSNWTAKRRDNSQMQLGPRILVDPKSGKTMQNIAELRLKKQVKIQKVRIYLESDPSDEEFISLTCWHGIYTPMSNEPMGLEAQAIKNPGSKKNIVVYDHVWPYSFDKKIKIIPSKSMGHPPHAPPAHGDPHLRSSFSSWRPGGEMLRSIFSFSEHTGHQ